MWARTQLKIDWTDLMAGGLACVVPGDRADLTRKVEGYFGDDLNVLAAYSVRTGFDLLLQALDLNDGDEVLFSALNIKGMVTIADRMAILLDINKLLDLHEFLLIEEIRRVHRPRCP